MGVFKAILGMIGIGKGEPVLSLGTVASGQPSPDHRDDDDDDDDDADSTRDGQLDIEDEWAELQMLVQRCEAEGLDIAGLDIDDPRTFWDRQARIERGRAEGKSQLHAVVSAGFKGVDHWEQVSRYYQAKWSQLVRLPGGEREIRPRDEFAAAAAAGARGPAGPSSDPDPRLLEPVHGVSLERWAQAAAALSRLRTHATTTEIDAALAPLRLDHATYAAADAAWQARMRRDVTMTIAARFGAAFEAAQG